MASFARKSMKMNKADVYKRQREVLLMPPRLSPLQKQMLCFVLGPLACFLIKDLPPAAGMAPEGMACLAGCVWLMIWWVTEVFSMPVTRCV